MLKAFSMLDQRKLGLRLKIVGDGELESDMRSLIEDLGLTEKVELLGTLNQHQILEELNRAKLFIMSSVAEGRPKVVAEALATGLPAVVTHACNCDDLVAHAGAAVETGNLQEMADAIEKLVSDKQYWQIASKQAENAVSNFTWDKIRILEQNKVEELILQVEKV